MNLKERSKKFMQEIGLPLSRFSQNVNLSCNAVRKWLNDELNLKPETEKRIDDFLKKYNQ